MRCGIAGCVLGTLVLQHAASLPDPLVPALAAALALLAGVRLPASPARAAVWLLAGCAFGTAYAAWRAQERLADELPFALEGIDLPLTGVIASLPVVGERGTRFLFAVEEGRAPALVSLSWYVPRQEGAPPVPALGAGERWSLTVRLKRPRGLQNPHAFDFEAWALERNIRATGYVREKPAAVRVDAHAPGWPQTLHRWRGEVRERMEAHLAGQPLRGVLVALAIGDQDAIDAVSWDVFWRTGIGHLVSISGLHITMLAALGFALVAWAWVRIPGAALLLPTRKAAAIAGVAVALAYTLMTGYAVPAQRTLLMLATMATCVLLDRHGSASRVLALAALVVILVDPWAVLSAGFWLSFGAVAAILGAVAARAGGGSKWQAAVREQAVVTLAMVPLLAALFQEMSLVSPLANAIAIPVVSLVVVPLTLAGAFLDLGAMLDLAHGLMQALMAPLERMAAWPLAMVELPEPTLPVLLLAICGCIWLLAPRGFPLRSFGALAILPLFVLQPPRPSDGEAWIDVLDVGNGLAIVVRTREHALVFDAGPAWSGDTDSGERIVVPFLRGEGVTALDMLVVSHADDDHAGGAITVAASREPLQLVSALPPDDATHGLVALRSPCRAGQRWRWDGVDFAMLHPGIPRDAAAPPRKENDWSCVLRVTSAGGTMLLPADAEARSEREMLARDRVALRADVLLAPHHGSRTSSTAAFLDAVGARDAIFTVGYRNRFRHPNPQVMQRYLERGARVWRSDRDGALRVALPAERGRPPEVEPLVPAMRYWRDRRSPP